jgi:hypothetical protein
MPPLAFTEPESGAIAGELQENGYCILRDALPADDIAALDIDLVPHFERTPFGRGAFYGDTTKRFGRLLLRSSRTEALVCHPQILRAVEEILAPWCDRIQLNTTQAIGIHPGAPAQLPHRDQERGSHASAPASRRRTRLASQDREARRDENLAEGLPPKCIQPTPIGNLHVIQHRNDPRHRGIRPRWRASGTTKRSAFARFASYSARDARAFSASVRTRWP